MGRRFLLRQRILFLPLACVCQRQCNACDLCACAGAERDKDVLTVIGGGHDASGQDETKKKGAEQHHGKQAMMIADLVPQIFHAFQA